MSSNLEHLRTHEAGFASFIKAMGMLIVGVTILLVFMALFLV